MSASYPPVGTRVRWTSSGRTREGVVVQLSRYDANTSSLAFNYGEVFGWEPSRLAGSDTRWKPSASVVLVDTVDGKPRQGTRRYYHPRAKWLEVVEPPGGEANP